MQSDDGLKKMATMQNSRKGTFGGPANEDSNMDGGVYQSPLTVTKTRPVNDVSIISGSEEEELIGEDQNDS